MKRVLIFEDDAISAMDFRQRLDTLGYEVIGIQTSAMDAVEEVRRLKPDLILMDISFGGKPDGIGAAGLISQEFDTPIVFATALSDGETIQRAQSCNPCGYIVKPFSTAILGATLTTALHLGDLRMKEKETIKIAQEASQAKSDFLASMSHELRTPLNSILGFAQLLAMDPAGRLDESQREYIHAVRASGEHLLSMIGDILDLAKIEAGKMELEVKPFDIAGMVTILAETMAAPAAQKGVQLLTDVEPGIGALEADGVRVKQILYNLLANAIKFAKSGRKTGLVVRGDESNVIFTVWDEGIGIAATEQDRILKPYEQVRQLDANVPGTGLGLAITRQLVELHHGQLELESAPGLGSRFTITLPGRIPDRRNNRLDNTDSRDSDRNQEPARDLKGKVLVVEDNPVNQKLMVAILDQLGCTTRLVASGEEAVALTAEENFDLVLLDINLPGIDGIETSQLIREKSGTGWNRRASDRRLPIVALTAHAMRGDQERFIAAGMDDVIFKPVDIAKLKLILEKYIKESDSRPAVPGQILGKHAPLIHPEEYDLAGTAAAIAISEEDLNSIVLEFFDHLAPSYLQDLEAAIQTGDKAAIRIAAHKLRGTTANLRFGPCVDELAFIENAAAGLECIDYHHRFLHLRLMLQNLERTIRGSVSHPLPDGPEDGVPRSFDPGKGLAFLGGDHDLYTVLLGTFVSRYALVEEELTCALGQGRYEEARRIIHGLKGAAANLGLSAVESGARVLEVRLAGGGQAAIGDSEVRSLLDAVKRILVEAPGIKP